MSGIVIPRRINQILEVFHLVGVWRENGDESNAVSQNGWKLKYLIVQASFALLLLVEGFLSNDKNEAIQSFSVGIPATVLTVKMGYILWRKDQIREFVIDIGVHSITDYDEEFKKMKKKMEKFLTFSFGSSVMIFMASVAVNIVCLPVFSSDRRLQFNIWFPLDWKNNLIFYWAAYAFTLIGIFSSAIATLFNNILWYLMLNCGIKYQILGNQLRNIGTVKPTVEKRKISEAEKEKLFLQELIGLIKTHRNIQKKVDEFKSCFANIFFTGITTSAICICGSVYVLAFDTHDAKLLQIMVNVAILSNNVFDIFMVTYFGNEIKLSSDRLSYCLFESNWIDRSPSYKKCVIILTEVLKQPHELVIGKLYPLNLETFTSIVNAAYSMFNILQNLN